MRAMQYTERNSNSRVQRMQHKRKRKRIPAGRIFYKANEGDLSRVRLVEWMRRQKEKKDETEIIN